MKLPQRKLKLIRTLAMMMVSVICLSALAACSPFSQQTDDTERVLRIATLQGYGPNDEWFRQQFTELYEFAHPNITIEVVPAVDYNKFRFDMGGSTPQEQPNPMEELKKLMAGDNPPDLVMIDYQQLPELINENLLTPLDTYISQDKFDTSKIVPTVIEGIKDVSSDGRLYALAPLFSSSALFYNKAIFDERGVPHPTDGMTWDDVFMLAQQVASGEGADKTYGFGFSTSKGSDPFWDMQIYTQPLQLRYFDEAGERMTVDTDQWQQVWQQMIDLRKQDIIPGPINYEEQPQNHRPSPYEWDSFISGKQAMAISSYYYVNELINANQMAETNEEMNPVQWDVVTIPVHRQAPDIGGYIWMQGLMGINAKAQNAEDAWEFIKFVNGDDWARLKSRSQGTLVSNKEYIQAKDGLEYNVEAFYQLKPVPMADDTEIYQKYPNIWEVQSIGQQKFQEALNGDKEVRQALQEWQTEGDARLKEMRENPQQRPGIEPMPIDTKEAVTEEAVSVESDVVAE